MGYSGPMNQCLWWKATSQTWICNYYNWTKAHYSNLYSQCIFCLHPLKTRGEFSERQESHEWVGARIWGNVGIGRISDSLLGLGQTSRKKAESCGEKWKHPHALLWWELIPSPYRHCFTQGTFLLDMSLLHAVDILKMLIIYII